MANFTANSTFNIGTDASILISDQYGDIFSAADLGDLMTINVNFDLHLLKVVPITNGGIPLYKAIPNGLTGHMDFVRNDGSITSIFTSLYNAFYTAGVTPSFSITITVLNHQGTSDEYIIPSAVFHAPTFGEFSGITEVRQKIEFSGPTILSTSMVLSNILAGLGY